MGNYLPVQGEHLRYLREKNGYTQEQVSDMIGVTVKTYRSWEKGKTSPAAIELISLSNLYHVSTDYLLGLIEEKSLDIKYICEYTELSETAIENLCYAPTYRKEFQYMSRRIRSAVLSDLLEIDQFCGILERIDSMNYYYGRVASAVEVLSKYDEEDCSSEEFNAAADNIMECLEPLRLNFFELSSAWNEMFNTSWNINNLISDAKKIQLKFDLF